MRPLFLESQISALLSTISISERIGFETDSPNLNSAFSSVCFAPTVVIGTVARESNLMVFFCAPRTVGPRSRFSSWPSPKLAGPQWQSDAVSSVTNSMPEIAETSASCTVSTAMQWKL